jgi:hypothetical protein
MRANFHWSKAPSQQGVPAHEKAFPRLPAGLVVPLTRQFHGKQAVVLFFHHRIALATPSF